jgi:hypothetical protein
MAMAEWLRPSGLFRLKKEMNKKRSLMFGSADCGNLWRKQRKSGKESIFDWTKL